MNRRKARAAVIVGLILFVLGLVVIGLGSLPEHLAGPAPVPAGSNLFRVAHWDVLAGGSARGRYTVTAGGPVEVLVLDAVNYTDFSVRVPYQALFASTGMEGNISADVHGLGTYYLVFAHLGSSTGTINATVDVTLSGVNPTWFFVGLAIVSAGTVVALVGYREVRAWTRPATPSLSAATPTAAPLPTDVDAPDPSTPGPPLGALRIGLENPTGAEETVRLRINGVDSTPVLVPARGRKTVGLYVTLPSRFGSLVTVEAKADTGESGKEEVFVRAYDRTTVEIRLG